MRTKCISESGPGGLFSSLKVGDIVIGTKGKNDGKIFKVVKMYKGLTVLSPWYDGEWCSPEACDQKWFDSCGYRLATKSEKTKSGINESMHSITEGIKSIKIDGFDYNDIDQVSAVAYMYGVSNKEAREGIQSGEYSTDEIKKACLYKFVVCDQPKKLSASEKNKMLKDLCKKNGIKESLEEGKTINITKKVKCPRCKSTDIDHWEKDAYYCNSCGYEFDTKDLNELTVQENFVAVLESAYEDYYVEGTGTDIAAICLGKIEEGLEEGMQLVESLLEGCDKLILESMLEARSKSTFDAKMNGSMMYTYYKKSGKFYKAMTGTYPLTPANGTEISEDEYNNAKHWMIESSSMDEEGTAVNNAKIVQEKKGKGLSVMINGKEYRYVSPTMSTDELFKKFKGMLDHANSGFKALNWLKKNALCYYGAKNPEGGELVGVE